MRLAKESAGMQDADESKYILMNSRKRLTFTSVYSYNSIGNELK